MAFMTALMSGVAGQGTGRIERYKDELARHAQMDALAQAQAQFDAQQAETKRYHDSQITSQEALANLRTVQATLAPTMTTARVNNLNSSTDVNNLGRLPNLQANTQLTREGKLPLAKAETTLVKEGKLPLAKAETTDVQTRHADRVAAIQERAAAAAANRDAAQARFFLALAQRMQIHQDNQTFQDRYTVALESLSPEGQHAYGKLTGTPGMTPEHALSIVMQSHFANPDDRKHLMTIFGARQSASDMLTPRVQAAANEKTTTNAKHDAETAFKDTIAKSPRFLILPPVAKDIIHTLMVKKGMSVEEIVKNIDGSKAVDAPTKAAIKSALKGP